MTLNFKNDTKWQWHKMTLFLFRAILIVHEKKSCTPKFKVYVFNTYTATYSTVLALFALFCLTSHHGFEQTAEKCIIFAEEKQHSAIWKQLSLRSFAFSLHRQPMKVLRKPRRRHLLRPRAVTIDDRRRSSIKTQKVALSGSWQSIKLSFQKPTELWLITAS